jgi:hypothetical protein
VLGERQAGFDAGVEIVRGLLALLNGGAQEFHPVATLLESLAFVAVVLGVRVRGSFERLDLRCELFVLDFQLGPPATRPSDRRFRGVYPITRIDDDTIVFSMDYRGPDNSVANAHGNIDRMTGKTTVFATRHDRPGQVAFYIDLMCSPARRLF